MTKISPNQDNVQILTELYCEVNEFMKTFNPISERFLIGEKRQRPFCRLSAGEIMTISIGFQIIGGKNFKSFYKKTICQFHKKEFPESVSYQRFIEVASMVLTPLMFFLKFRMEISEKTGVYVIDSTTIKVCENKRIPRHKVFAAEAERGKNSGGAAKVVIKVC